MSDRSRAAEEFERSATAYWERNGLSRAAGAILSHLMVCEPAALTQRQLAQALKISAGTVSTQLHLLERIGFVERVRVAGERTGRYQLPPNMWTRILLAERERLAGLAELAALGMAAMPPSRSDRVTSLDAMVRFWDVEWPGLEERFQQFVERREQ